MPNDDDELWNFKTHFFGLFLIIVGTPILLLFNQKQTEYSTVSIVIYCLGLIFVYLSSTLYHYSKNIEIKKKLRIVDHVSIYFLIIGSYAPVCFITLYQGSGLVIFIAVLIISILGIIYKIFSKSRFRNYSIFFYLILGWLIVFEINTLFELIEFNAKVLLILGGLSYTTGIIFYLLDKIKYFHAIWHIFVLVGSISHYFMILFYII